MDFHTQMDLDHAAMLDTSSGDAVKAELNNKEIAGYFDVPYGEELDVAGSKPTFQCPSADVETALEGDLLKLTTGRNAGDVYRLKVDPQHDGTGWATLILETP